MAELNARQAKFVDAYLAHGNATRAYQEAGYTPDSTGASASRLLGNDRVAAAIAERQASAAEAAGVTAERVRRELAAIAFADVREVAEWRDVAINEEGDSATLLRLRVAEELTEDAARSISEVRTDAQGRLTLRQHDKMRALELLGKDLGMFKDTVRHELPGAVVVKLAFDAGEQE